MPFSQRDFKSTGTAFGNSPKSTQVTGAVAPVAGDLLLAVITYTTDTTSGPQYEPDRSVTDNVGNIWVEALHLFNPNGAPIGSMGPYTAGEGISIWYCLSAVASTPTVTTVLSC